MKYGYARVSTPGQADGNSLEAQFAALNEAGADKIYQEVCTGTKTDRPIFKQLIKKLKGGDMLIVTKLDRFARSLPQASVIITKLLDKDVKINVLNIGIIDNSPTSKLLRNMLLAIAEFERDMIVERTREGKLIAKNDPNYREGRPYVYSKEEIENALELLKTHSYDQVTEMTNISKSTLLRAKKNLEKQRRD